MPRGRRGWKTTSYMGNLGLGNLNGHVICAIDTETTGLNAGFHDMIELAVVPLDANFDQIKEIQVAGEMKTLYAFDMLVRPKRPENIAPDAMKVNGIRLEDLDLHGLEPFRATERFDDWFKSLNLAPGKKIVPLAKNWAFDASFIKDWLGPDNFNAIFHHRARELSGVVNFWNDRAEFQGEKCPFPQQGLQEVASVLEIPRARQHRAYDDALLTAKIYKVLMRRYIK